MSPNLPKPSQAQAMIERVSPEGRARAQKERERRRRASARVAGQAIIAAIVIALVAWGIDAALIPLGLVGLLVAILAFVVACIAIGFFARERPARSKDLAQTRLDQLPARTELWLEQQRPALPQPTFELLDSIALGLGDMAPQLVALDAREPAADAVRRLLGTDLPALVRGYQAIPASLRSEPRGGGQSADAHLLHGLGVIDSEITRMTEQLARGAFNELATQNRFLELKYDSAGRLD